MTTINMLGKPCPLPVVEAKKALAQPGTHGVIVQVDNIIAVQNLGKMAGRLGYGFSWKQRGEGVFAATIQAKNPNGQPITVPQPEPVIASESLVFFITGDQIGISDEKPGKELMKSFLLSLAQSPVVPETILLVNTGVKLAAEGSEVLDHLKTISKNGAKILSCGQCLNYYGLTDKLAVGKITNMLEIVEILSSAQRTVTL